MTGGGPDSCTLWRAHGHVPTRPLWRAREGRGLQTGKLKRRSRGGTESISMQPQPSVLLDTHIISSTAPDTHTVHTQPCTHTHTHTHTHNHTTQTHYTHTNTHTRHTQPCTHTHTLYTYKQTHTHTHTQCTQTHTHTHTLYTCIQACKYAVPQTDTHMHT